MFNSAVLYLVSYQFEYSTYVEGAFLINQVPSYLVNCQDIPAQTTILKLTLSRRLVKKIQVYHHQYTEQLSILKQRNTRFITSSTNMLHANVSAWAAWGHHCNLLPDMTEN